MAREGYPFAGASAGAALIAGIAGWWFDYALFAVFSGVFLVCALFVCYFFRDPDRAAAGGEDDILSPGDGRVVAVVEEEEEHFFKNRIRRVSVFLSLFDVHVNRVPMDGTVACVRYQAGSFKAAFREDASQRNEQTVIGISQGGRKILFKQIAGILARRIVCTLTEGERVARGDRCGIIRFGSRVDILMPLDVNVLVAKGQKVYGGITCIGRFPHEK